MSAHVHLLLVAADIQRGTGQTVDDSELLVLMGRNSGDDWARIQKRYQQSMEEL